MCRIDSVFYTKHLYTIHCHLIYPIRQPTCPSCPSPACFTPVTTTWTDGAIFDPWATSAVHIFGTACNTILKFYDFS